MRTSRLLTRSSALLVLPFAACVTLAACSSSSGDDGTSTDAGAADTSQSDTSTTDAAHDSATTDSAAHDASADSAADAPADAPTTDGSGDDAADAADAAPSTVVPCDPNTTPTATITVGAASTDSFAPLLTTIAVGDTVQWTWAGDGHSVSSVANGTSCTPDGEFCSTNDMNCSAGTTSNTGTTYCQKFTAAGTFNFVCVPHCSFGMRGSVVVTP